MPIREYKQRFFPNLPTSCPCSKAKVQTQEHISMTSMTYLHTSVTLLSTALFTSLQTILELLALTMDRDLLQCDS